MLVVIFTYERVKIGSDYLNPGDVKKYIGGNTEVGWRICISQTSQARLSLPVRGHTLRTTGVENFPAPSFPFVVPDLSPFLSQ